MQTSASITIFRIVSHRRTTFFRSEIHLTIEQALTSIVDGAVLEGFRFETTYGEVCQLRSKMTLYIQKIFEHDQFPEIAELRSTSPQETVDKIFRAIETMFDLIQRKKYLRQSPVYLNFMRFKKRLPLNEPEEEKKEYDKNDSDKISVHSITSTQQLAEQQSYMIEASALLVGAQRHESEGNYFESYDLYKETIETLLAGARKDDNQENVAKVKQKISSLLEKANELYEQHLVNSQRHGRSTIGTSETDPNYEFAMSELAKLFQQYKTIGPSGKVVIIEEKQSGRKFVVKSLRKSAALLCLNEPTNPVIIPTDVERMVHLHSLHETDSSLLLILQYIENGQTLFSYLGLTRCYPSAVAPNPTPLDPNSSMLTLKNPQKSARELLFRKWSLNLSSSDWNSAFHPQHHHHHSLMKAGRTTSTTSPPLENDEDDFQRVLNAASQTGAASQFSIDTPFSKSVRRASNESDAFIENPEATDVEPSQSANDENYINATVEAMYKVDFDNVKRWFLQLLTTVEALHRYGLVWADLNPNNVLYNHTDNGIAVTFICSWVGVERFNFNKDALKNGFVAPEILLSLNTEKQISMAADYWSLGAILFTLLTGVNIAACLGSDFDMFCIMATNIEIEIKELVVDRIRDKNASALILELLKPDPAFRLTSGDEIRSHCFFSYK